MSDLELRHLQYLIAVAETGSITQAAQRMMITQPALSRALRALERTVGVQLLVRGSHRTGLTTAGSALLVDAYEMVEQARVALARARDRGRAAETLTVSVPACDLVAVRAAIRSFEVSHSGVQVNAVPYEWVSDPDEVRSGRADVMFLRDCFDRDELTVEELGREPRMVLVAADHPLVDRGRLTVSDLRDEPVSYWSGMSAEDGAHWSGADTDRKPRRHGPPVNSRIDIISSILLGRAVALVHQSTLPEHEPPGLRALPVDGLSESRLEIGVSARSANPIARQFMDFVCADWPASGR